MSLNPGINAQSSIDSESLDSLKKSKFDSRNLHGRWHLVEIILALDDSDGLGAKAEEALQKSTESQRKVKQQIQAGELAIITQFNYDDTYIHELVYADPEIRFPSYREPGTWTFNENTHQLLRKANDQEIAMKKYTLMMLDNDNLVLELRFTNHEYEGVYKGVVETIRLRRFRETKAH